MSNREKFLILCSLVVMGPAFGGLLRAGDDRTNIRGVGMGRTTVAVSRGLDAVGINPANLGFSDKATVTLGIVPAAIHFGSDFFTYKLYQDYFTGVKTDSGTFARSLTDADKQQILNSFPGSVGHITGDAVSRPLGLSIRFGSAVTIALTFTEHVTGSAELPNEYLQFLFYGNTPGSSYDFDGSRGSMAWTREFAVSAGFELPDFGILESLYGGAAVKVVHGFAYYELSRFNTKLSTSPYGVLDGHVNMLGRSASIDAFGGSRGSSFSIFPAPAGTGIGVDLGLTGEVRDGMLLAISVTDIGSMRWTRNVQEIIGGGAIHFEDPLNKGQRDSVMDAVHGEVYDGDPFTTMMPTTIRMGVALEARKVSWIRHAVPLDVTLAFEYDQGLVETPGTSIHPRLSAGMEYRPWKFLPLRTGFSWGGDTEFSFALGFGLNFGVVDFDLASDNLEWLFAPESFSYGSIAVGMKFRI